MQHAWIATALWQGQVSGQCLAPACSVSAELETPTGQRPDPEILAVVVF